MELDNFVEDVKTMFRSMMEPQTTGTVTPVVISTLVMMMVITLDLMVPTLALPPIMEYGVCKMV